MCVCVCRGEEKREGERVRKKSNSRVKCHTLANPAQITKLGKTFIEGGRGKEGGGRKGEG